MVEATEQRLLEKIRQLPLDKIAEVERFIDSLAQSNKYQPITKEELEAMACDPEIQAEIAAINREFLMTEMDGLDEE